MSTEYSEPLTLYNEYNNISIIFSLSLECADHCALVRGQGVYCFPFVGWYRISGNNTYSYNKIGV